VDATSETLNWHQYRCDRRLVADADRLCSLLSSTGLDVHLAPEWQGLACQVGNDVILIRLEPREYFRNLEIWPPIKPRCRTLSELAQLEAALSAIDAVLTREGASRLTNPEAEEMAALEQHFGGLPEFREAQVQIAEYNTKMEQCVADQDFKTASIYRDRKRELINGFWSRLDEGDRNGA